LEVCGKQSETGKRKEISSCEVGKIRVKEQAVVGSKKEQKKQRGIK
jgi:hypothetical protein